LLFQTQFYALQVLLAFQAQHFPQMQFSHRHFPKFNIPKKVKDKYYWPTKLSIGGILGKIKRSEKFWLIGKLHLGRLSG